MRISPSNQIVIMMAVTADQYAVCVGLAGDVDLVAEPDLARLARSLATTRCSVVHIDLNGITFAGSSLVNFLFLISGRLSGPTAMTLCRPSTMTRQLIRLTGLNDVATVRRGLPPDWTAPWSTTSKPVAMHAVTLHEHTQPLKAGGSGLHRTPDRWRGESPGWHAAGV